MATRMLAYKHKPLRITWVKKRDEIIEKLTPRPCIVVSRGLIVAGLAVPMFMVFGILPVSLLLGFVGFALVATGGVLALIYCGEL